MYMSMCMCTHPSHILFSSGKFLKKGILNSFVKQKDPDTKQPKGERAHCSSQFQVTFHHFGSHSSKSQSPWQLVTWHPQSMAEIEWIHAPLLLVVPPLDFPFNTVQGLFLGNGATHSQLGLATSINFGKLIPLSVSTGESNVDHPPLRLLSVSRGCVKWKIKANHHSGLLKTDWPHQAV